MHEVFERCIAEILKSVGYEQADTRSIKSLRSQTENTLQGFLRSYKIRTNHALKAKSTFNDLIEYAQDCKIEIGANDLHTFSPIIIEKEEAVVEEVFSNPIASSMERYIHIYEHMPAFPPTHTFKKTFVKHARNEVKSENARAKLEQIAKAENNPYFMLKKTKQMPKHVNYLS